MQWKTLVDDAYIFITRFMVSQMLLSSIQRENNNDDTKCSWEYPDIPRTILENA